MLSLKHSMWEKNNGLTFWGGMGDTGFESVTSTECGRKCKNKKRRKDISSIVLIQDQINEFHGCFIDLLWVIGE